VHHDELRPGRWSWRRFFAAAARKLFVSTLLPLHNAVAVNLFRQVDYAIRCIIYLCDTRDRLATKSEIAKSVSAPDLFVAKILQRLVRAGIVLSVRGVHGGFVMARDPSTLSLLDVIEVTQAPLAPRPCVLNPRACPYRDTCVVNPIWVKIHRWTVRELRKVTFATLARRSRKMSKSRKPRLPCPSLADG
jgi:Rrf2 family protein